MGVVTRLIFYPFFPSVYPRADIGKLQLNYINSIPGWGGKVTTLNPTSYFSLAISLAIPLIFVPPWTPPPKSAGDIVLTALSLWPAHF